MSKALPTRALATTLLALVSVAAQAQAQNDRVTRVMGSIEVPLHPMWQESYADKISLLRIRHKNRPNVPRP